jgi:hypothetical protein
MRNELLAGCTWTEWTEGRTRNRAFCTRKPEWTEWTEDRSAPTFGRRFSHCGAPYPVGESTQSTRSTRSTYYKSADPAGPPLGPTSVHPRGFCRMNILYTLASLPSRCSVKGCTRAALPDRSECAMHAKSDSTRVSELESDAIDALAASLRAASYAQDYRAVATIADKILTLVPTIGRKATATRDEYSARVAAMSDVELAAEVERLAAVSRDMVADRQPATIEATPLDPPPLTPTYESFETTPKCTGNERISGTANGSLTGSDANAGASPAPSPPAAPIERCAYCLRSLADCADLRATDPDKFEALHVGSPEDIEKRRKEETAVMLRRAGTLPSWY